MNRQTTPDRIEYQKTDQDMVGKNIFRTTTNIVEGIIESYPKQNPKFQDPNPKQKPIPKFFNVRNKDLELFAVWKFIIFKKGRIRRKLFGYWNLVLGISYYIGGSWISIENLLLWYKCN